MIQHILVALDADSDTPVATRYAVEIAQRHNALLSGMAIVDVASIDSDSRGGSIGSMYYMKKITAALTSEARTIAQELLDDFRSAVSDKGVDSEARVEEGLPIKRIVDDVNYSDLLVIGKEPHFFYSHPEATSVTLQQVVQKVTTPTLIAPTSYREVNRVLVAFDGSAACVRSLRSFLYHRPFGKDLTVGVCNVHARGGRDSSQLMLHKVKQYAASHGFTVDTYSIASEGQPSKEILAGLEKMESDLLVSGAQIMGPLAKLAFGSTTATLLDEVSIPMWVSS